MRSRRLRSLAVALAVLVGALTVTASASAATGDTLRTITAGGGSCSVNTGLALVPSGGGQLEGAISCWDDSRIDFFKLSDGSFDRTISVANASTLGALAYDATRKKIWGCNNYNQVILIDPATGANTSAFTSNGCLDGLAYDGSDDTLWTSPDANCNVTHYTTTGTSLGTKDVCSVSGWSGNGNSGIAVGGTDLYMANDGSSQIYQVPKDFSKATLFHQGDRRIEDEECDNTTFRSAGHGAIWFIDAYDRQVQALEIPPDLCGSGGLSAQEGPPGSPSCSDGIDNDGNGLTDGADPKCQTPAPRPTARTTAAQKVKPRSATLTGNVDPNGKPTTYRFEFGLNKQYGHLTPWKNAGAGGSGKSFSDAIAGLKPNTLYHFQIMGRSAGGTVLGGDRTFRTPPAPRPHPQPQGQGCLYGNQSTTSGGSGVIQQNGCQDTSAQSG